MGYDFVCSVGVCSWATLRQFHYVGVRSHSFRFAKTNHSNIVWVLRRQVRRGGACGTSTRWFLPSLFVCLWQLLSWTARRCLHGRLEWRSGVIASPKFDLTYDGHAREKCAGRQGLVHGYLDGVRKGGDSNEIHICWLPRRNLAAIAPIQVAQPRVFECDFSGNLHICVG